MRNRIACTILAVLVLTGLSSYGWYTLAHEPLIWRGLILTGFTGVGLGSGAYLALLAHTCCISVDGRKGRQELQAARRPRVKHVAHNLGFALLFAAMFGIYDAVACYAQSQDAPTYGQPFPYIREYWLSAAAIAAGSLIGAALTYLLPARQMEGHITLMARFRARRGAQATSVPAPLQDTTPELGADPPLYGAESFRYPTELFRR